jgi:hypothetical protein
MALSEEVGVAQPTLSKWVREAGRVGDMGKSKRTRAGSRKRPQDWTAEAKLEAVVEADSLSEEDLGTFLRGRGLHRAHLTQWREQIVAGLKVPRSKKTSAEARRIRELERELRRKDKALAETAALLVLKKKVQAIWGDEDGDTTRRNGRWSST